MNESSCVLRTGYNDYMHKIRVREISPNKFVVEETNACDGTYWNVVYGNISREVATDLMHELAELRRKEKIELEAFRLRKSVGMDIVAEIKI